MASIVLDVFNIVDVFSTNSFVNLSDYLHELTHGLDVTFDEPRPGINEGVPVIEFTGDYDTLVTLIERYEDDEELREELVEEIKE